VEYAASTILAVVVAPVDPAAATRGATAGSNSSNAATSQRDSIIMGDDGGRCRLADRALSLMRAMIRCLCNEM
jgi:hypothetical protein